MEPPICTICGVDHTTSGEEFELVRFRPHEVANGVPLDSVDWVGHPSNLAWFCEDHVDRGYHFRHLTLPDATPHLQNPEEWYERERAAEAVLLPLVASILRPGEVGRVGTGLREELVQQVREDREWLDRSAAVAALDWLPEHSFIEERSAENREKFGLTATGLEYFHEVSGKEVILPDDLLEVLQAAQHGSHMLQHGRPLSYNELQEVTGLPDDRLRLAIWYLSRRNFIDVESPSENDWIGEVRITVAGEWITDAWHLLIQVDRRA